MGILIINCLAMEHKDDRMIVNLDMHPCKVELLLLEQLDNRLKSLEIGYEIKFKEMREKASLENNKEELMRIEISYSDWRKKHSRAYVTKYMEVKEVVKNNEKMREMHILTQIQKL
jgi:hypothetical protein